MKRKFGWKCRSCCQASWCSTICGQCRDTRPEDCLSCHPELKEEYRKQLKEIK